MPTYHEIMTTDLGALVTAAERWDGMAGEYGRRHRRSHLNHSLQNERRRLLHPHPPSPPPIGLMDHTHRKDIEKFVRAYFAATLKTLGCK
jgi:hypothetical protein